MQGFFGNLGQAILVGVAEVVAPILGSIVAVMAIAVLKRLMKKYKLDISEKEEAQLRDQVQRIVRGIEEESRTSPMTPEQKLSEATARVQQAADLPYTEAARKVHEEMPVVRATIDPVRPNPLSPVA